MTVCGTCGGTGTIQKKVWIVVPHLRGVVPPLTGPAAPAFRPTKTFPCPTCRKTAEPAPEKA